MPKNLKGGKAYKRMKQGGDDDRTMVECNYEDGQQYGRILRNLGGMNLIVYCNDGNERMCHVRGGIKKSCRMHEGDIVIISLRDLYNGEGGGKTAKGQERGDILGRVDPKHYSIMRRDPQVNQSLFTALEAMDEKSRKVPAHEQGGFIFGYDNEDEEQPENTVQTGEEGAVEGQALPAGGAGRPKRGGKRAPVVWGGDDDEGGPTFNDSNIDAI
jgi:translation initiation factor 1A